MYVIIDYYMYKVKVEIIFIHQKKFKIKWQEINKNWIIFIKILKKLINNFKQELFHKKKLMNKWDKLKKMHKKLLRYKNI